MGVEGGDSENAEIVPKLFQNTKDKIDKRQVLFSFSISIERYSVSVINLRNAQPCFYLKFMNHKISHGIYDIILGLFHRAKTYTKNNLLES